MQSDIFQDLVQMFSVCVQDAFADAIVLQKLFRCHLIQRFCLTFEALYSCLQSLQDIFVELISYLDLARGQDVLVLQLTQALAVLPFEDLGEVVKVVGHEGVEDMTIFEKIDAILHEVVDELAQNYLLGGFAFELEQSRFHLLNGFVSQEQTEIYLRDLASISKIVLA